MEFKGINRHTVQCIISEEEMRDYGVQAEDFINNKEAVHGFIDHLVEECIDELGYFPSGGAIAMQVARDSNGYFNILLTDEVGRKDDISEILRYLRNMTGISGNNVENTSDDDASSTTLEDILKEGRSSAADEENTADSDKKNKKKLSFFPVLLRFENLEDTGRFAKAVHASEKISSSVYKDEESGMFYILVRKGKLKPVDFVSELFRMKEFSELIPGNYATEQYCREHYRLLIKKHALQVLEKYDL